MKNIYYKNWTKTANSRKSYFNTKDFPSLKLKKCSVCQKKCKDCKQLSIDETEPFFSTRCRDHMSNVDKCRNHTRDVDKCDVKDGDLTAARYTGHF